jgi:AcrR family transcriptional regulator
VALRKSRGAYHHGDLRQALVLATLEIVDREGTGAVSLSAAARRVGVSPQASYNHFRAKADLLAAAAELVMRDLAVAMQARAAGARTPGDRFERLGIAYVAFAVAHAARFRLLGVPELADKSRHPGLLAAHASSAAALIAVVEDCIAAGVVRASAPDKLARTAWATVHGIAALVIEGQLAGDATTLARDAIRVLFKGLRATG